MSVRSDSNKIPQCEETGGPEIFPLLPPGSAHAHPWAGQTPQQPREWEELASTKHSLPWHSQRASRHKSTAAGSAVNAPALLCTAHSQRGTQEPWQSRNRPQAGPRQGKPPNKRSIHWRRMVQEAAKHRLGRQDTPPAPCASGKKS